MDLKLAGDEVVGYTGLRRGGAVSPIAENARLGYRPAPTQLVVTGPLAPT